MSVEARWSIADKACLITGASSGIGFETALALARQNARLTLVCRDPVRGEQTARMIRERTDSRYVDVMVADLSAMDEVRRLGAEYGHDGRPLHVLINNAGVLNLTRRRRVTGDGFEETFAVNYLAPFLLTHLLLARLLAGAPARVINVSSTMHKYARLDFDDLHGERRFSGVRAYCRAKLALNLFTRTLARRVEGSGVTVNCLHPGGVATAIFRDLPAPLRPLVMLFARRPAHGARTTVYLATSPEVADTTGCYFVDRRAVHASAASYDDHDAERLWRLTTHLLRLTQEDGACGEAGCCEDQVRAPDVHRS